MKEDVIIMNIKIRNNRVATIALSAHWRSGLQRLFGRIAVHPLLLRL